jgi:nitrite reductase (NADH) small subunit
LEIAISSNSIHAGDAEIPSGTAGAKHGTMVSTMALIRIAALDELPEGRLLQREAAGTTVAICNHAGKIHAFNGLCPHRAGPLGQGNLVDGCIVCPWHAWEFSVEKGELDYNPDIKLHRYNVVVQGGDVLVDLD